MRPALGSFDTYVADVTKPGVTVIDLYTFLIGGVPFRYIEYSLYPVTGNQITLPCSAFPGSPLNFNGGAGTISFLVGPKFGRTKLKQAVGISTASTLEIDVFATPTDLIGGLTWQQVAEYSLLDQVPVELNRLFLPLGGLSFSDLSLGALCWFYGAVGDVEIGRQTIKLKVESFVNKLATQQMPRRLFQAGCTHVFGDTMCGYNRTAGTAANGTVTGIGQVNITAQGGSNQGSIITSFVPTTAGSYDNGTIIGSSGGNNGSARQIVHLGGGVIDLDKLWLYPVTAGVDTFQLFPGCDHTSNTCKNTFQNILRYGGFDYIPQPELSI